MYNQKILTKLFAAFKSITAAALLILFFINPAKTFNGVTSGLLLCYDRLIPSLFPFFIISGLIMASPLAHHVGIILQGYTRLIGIKSSKASSGLLLGFLGGFASAAMLTYSLYESNDISESDASLLLCIGGVSGPAFVINTVGYGMLGSSIAGCYLYASLFLSSLCCGVIMRFFISSNKDKQPLLTVKASKNVFEILQGSVNSMLMLCGFVVFFSFVSAIVLPQDASKVLKYFISSLLEVTLGCKAAAEIGTGSIYLASAALSVSGVCVVLQIQAFCKAKINMWPYIFSRLIHLPLALLFLYALLKLMPVDISVYSDAGIIAVYRLPADTLVAFFLLLLAFFGDLKALPYLRKKKNKLY